MLTLPRFAFLIETLCIDLPRSHGNDPIERFARKHPTERSLEQQPLQHGRLALRQFQLTSVLVTDLSEQP